METITIYAYLDQAKEIVQGNSGYAFSQSDGSSGVVQLNVCFNRVSQIRYADARDGNYDNIIVYVEEG